MAAPFPFLPPRALVILLLLPLILRHVASLPSSANETAARTNPFSARAAAIRYWNRKVPTNRPQPAFLLSKLSPLSALDSATFSSLAAAGASALSSRLPALCSAARLLCSPSPTTSPASDLDHPPSDFATYQNSNFSNYGTRANAGFDSFKNYSDSLNLSQDTFRRYSRGSVGHNDSFASYSGDVNSADTNFTSYASSAIGGAGEFTSYAVGANDPGNKFANYDAFATGRHQSFGKYSDEANAGDQSFAGYGKGGNSVVSEFKSYADNTNVVGSTFRGYGQGAFAANDSFSSYGFDGNVPVNTFRSYGDGGTVASESFATYRDEANTGNDVFTSYAKGSKKATADFVNYGDSFNQGTDSFKGYGLGSITPEVRFERYANENTTFAAYAKSGIDFKIYTEPAAAPDHIAAARKRGEKPVGRWIVEPGKFFRECDLQSGNVMPMPDIRDKMPPRSFLPRSIAGSIPFSADEVRRTFRIPADTTLGKALADTVAECERKPSRGETKRCVTSAEDMIDFAVAVLGSDVVVRSTESTAGSKGPVMVGKVRAVNGGNVTRSVSCHQSLFPYLAYYCHSVPRVRLYVADILAVATKERINGGVAICHLDTSDWSASHGAFLSLGSAPGKIEVCHWIFEGDMTWTVSD